MMSTQKTEYYSAKKKNVVLMHTIIWMHFENIMLSKRNQS